MKLVHPEWEKQIVFDFKSVPIVSIENPTYYYQVVEELYQQTEGKEGSFVLSDDGEILDFRKHVQLLVSPWTMDFSTAVVTKRLCNRLQEEANNEQHYTKTKEVMQHVLSYLQELEQELPIPLTYDWNPDVANLFKAVHVQVDTSDLNVMEKMIEYMKLWTELFGKTCFIFNQFRTYLPKSMRKEFYTCAMEEEIPFLLLEGACHDTIEQESCLIIDEDLCQIF